MRFAVDAYVNFARQQPWIEAVASSLTELFGPSAIKVRLAALERALPMDRPGRACSTSATGSCRRRAMPSTRSASSSSAAATREQQERAVAALQFKTEVLWAQLEAIERGDTQPQAPA